MNEVKLFGRIGKDPEFKQFDNGCICNISVATDESYKDKDGKKVEQTEWHNVVFRGNQSEVVNKFFKKGHRILLGGKLKTRSWGEDGAKKHITEVHANWFEFVEKAESKNSSPENKPVPQSNVSDDDLPF